MQDPIPVFINYRKTLEKITLFRQLDRNKQDKLIQEIKNATEQVINQLRFIQDVDEKRILGKVE